MYREGDKDPRVVWLEEEREKERKERKNWLRRQAYQDKARDLVVKVILGDDYTEGDDIADSLRKMIDKVEVKDEVLLGLRERLTRYHLHWLGYNDKIRENLYEVKVTKEQAVVLEELLKEVII